LLELAVKTLLAYLLGSVMGALWVGRLRGVDIREQGSGNAGGTNALRTQGKAFALGVVVIDIAKGWLAAAWLPAVAWPGIPADPLVDRDWLAVACSVAAVVGHVFPVWHEFRGGKGAATVVGALIGLAPLLLLPLLGVWLLLVMLFGYVGLATISAAATVPMAAWWLDGRPALIVFGVAIAAFVAWTHRSNLARMRAGQLAAVAIPPGAGKPR